MNAEFQQFLQSLRSLIDRFAEHEPDHTPDPDEEDALERTRTLVDQINELRSENAALVASVRRSNDDIGNLRAHLDMANAKLQQTPGIQALQERLNRADTEISRLRVALEAEFRVCREISAARDIVVEERDVIREAAQRLGDPFPVACLDFVSDYTFEPPQGAYASVPWPRHGRNGGGRPPKVVLRMFATPAKKVDDDV